MQYHNNHWRSQRLLSRHQSLLALLGAAALLAALAVAGIWSQAHAAPQSGGPALTIVSMDGNSLTLQFDGWQTGETITLTYSASPTCTPSQSLPNNTFPVTGASFQTTYEMPGSGIQAGTYYLCATGSVSGGPLPSDKTIMVNVTGTVRPTHGPGTSQPTISASSSPITSATGTTDSGAGQPGNGGTAQSTGSTFSSGALAAVILFCLLVLGASLRR